MNGTIKTLRPERGFGFIAYEGAPKDLFFHSKNLLNGLTIEELKEGDAVAFEIEQGEKGPAAVKVVRA